MYGRAICSSILRLVTERLTDKEKHIIKEQDISKSSLLDQIHNLNEEVQSLRSEIDEMHNIFHDVLQTIGKENARRDSEISRIISILESLSRPFNKQ